MITGTNGPYNAYEILEFVEKKHKDESLKARNIPLDELAKQLELMADDFKNPFIASASSRLAHVAAALTCLQDALFYVRMYKSLDTTGEGERRRQELIDDSESVISLIRTGGLYP
jgi:hypothetical protein